MSSNIPGRSLSDWPAEVRLIAVTGCRGSRESAVDEVSAYAAVDAVDVVLPLANAAARGFADLTRLVDGLRDGPVLDRARLQRLRDYLDAPQLWDAVEAYTELMRLDPRLVAAVAPLAVAAAREAC